MAKLCGKWKLENTENFDAYMKAVGVGLALRKLGNLAKPSQNISCDGDTYTIKTVSTAKNTEVSFKVGAEFDEKTADGRHVKTTFSVEGDNKLIASQKGEPDSVHTREVRADDSMVMTLEACGVVCTRTYKRSS